MEKSNEITNTRTTQQNQSKIWDEEPSTIWDEEATNERFYRDRPAIVSMRSNLLEKLLGRPARSIEDAATLEFIDGN